MSTKCNSKKELHTAGALQEHQYIKNSQLDNQKEINTLQLVTHSKVNTTVNLDSTTGCIVV